MTGGAVVAGRGPPHQLEAEPKTLDPVRCGRRYPPRAMTQGGTNTCPHRGV